MGAYQEMAYPAFAAVTNASPAVVRMWHYGLAWPRTVEEYVIRRYIEKRHIRMCGPVPGEIEEDF